MALQVNSSGLSRNLGFGLPWSLDVLGGLFAVRQQDVGLGGTGDYGSHGI
jgi:hypothetical protein